MRSVLLSVLVLVAISPAHAQFPQDPPTLGWAWTAVYPSLPPGTIAEVGQLDGVGGDEIVVYHPPTGRAWVAWVNRNALGTPTYCIDEHQFPAGFVDVEIGHFDTWVLDGSDQRQDLVLIPASGPLYFATTWINRAGRCYVGG